MYIYQKEYNQKNEKETVALHTVTPIFLMFIYILVFRNEIGFTFAVKLSYNIYVCPQ